MSKLGFAARSAAVFVGLALPLLLGCSSDEPVPFCENCGDWTQLTAGLGRFPEPHPSSSEYVLFSTVDKTPGAPDADRTADEDLWLLHVPTGTQWQLTEDGLGAGDNFGARWSPSGTQIAFVHTTSTGQFEIWRMPVTLPGSPADAPILGAPERMLGSARDVAWSSETGFVFVRNDKLFQVSIPAGSGPPVSAEQQISFDPPLFASTEVFVDRHPMFAEDGGAVFNTLGRQSVASAFVRAFEVDDSVFPPDTTETTAWVSFQSPGADNPSYPLFLGLDTLRTPVSLRSVPVGAGGGFRIGVRRDSRFLPTDPAPENYCDTTLVVNVDLQPGDVDTVSYFFRLVRGDLKIEAGLPGTTIFWTRKDARETIADYTSDFLLGNLGETALFECLLPFAVDPIGNINTAVPETIVVSGTNGSLKDTARVVLEPGRTKVVEMFPVANVTGTLTFSDNPSIAPPISILVLLPPNAEVIAVGASDSTGAFSVPRVPEGTFDVTFDAAFGYADTTITGVTVSPPGDVDLGTVMMMADGSLAGARELAPVELAATQTERAGRTTVHGPKRTEPGPGSSAALAPFRAEGDLSTVWRLQVEAAGAGPPAFNELFGSTAQIQSPAVTQDLNGVRYVAYVSDELGEWSLFVQRLTNWQEDGAPVRIEPPGSSDNLDCARNIFHPRWATPTAAGALRLIVAMSDCPDNGFEELGFDDDPWAIGEIRLWEVELPPEF